MAGTAAADTGRGRAPVLDQRVDGPEPCSRQHTDSVRRLDPLSSLPVERRKTSLVVDFEKVAAAREVLGTATLTDTIDAALSSVVDHARQRRLLDFIADHGDEFDWDAADRAARGRIPR